jgi:hypothetical protein
VISTFFSAYDPRRLKPNRMTGKKYGNLEELQRKS